MEHLKRVVEIATSIETEVKNHMIGQQKLIEETIICMLAGGNILLEGVPGLGKTRLVNVLGTVLGLDFKRIQFTPDLMPADITGTNIYNKESGQFEFQQGPVFTNIVLADEINRATPKTQSAMLEAMQEKTITVAGHTYKLPKPYLVMATQNPIEQEGTYPLPEAQLDRFMFKLIVEFPTTEELLAIVNLTTGVAEAPIQRVTDAETLLEAQNLACEVLVADPVLAYAVKLVSATQDTSPYATETIKKHVSFGASPRAAQGLIKAAKVRALLKGRFNVSFEDIKVLAYPILRHRLVLSFDALTDKIGPDQIIEQLLREIEV